MDEAQLSQRILSHSPIALTLQQATLCSRYLLLLQQWNRRFNLTAVRELDAMVALHIYDSLSVLGFLQAGKLLDVGTGAGLPGIIIGIMQPDREIALLDSNSKKTRFLLQAIANLQLDNISVHHQRVEQHQVDVSYDNIVSRAFSELALLVGCSKHLLSPRGRWIAMKGVYPQTELDELADTGAQLHTVNAVTVPELEAQRHVVVLGHQQQ